MTQENPNRLLDMIEARLWSEERQLWTGNAEQVAARLAPFCLMAVPGAGILTGQTILERFGVGRSRQPRFTTLKMSDQQFTSHHGVAVLAYRALARRGIEAAYECWCSSCWAMRRGRWQMIQHQETPVQVACPEAAPL